MARPIDRTSALNELSKAAMLIIIGTLAGRAWRETDVEHTDLETVIADLMSGQYANPVTVVAFNMAERWANDVSEDIAREIQIRADLADTDLSSNLENFVERHAGRQERQLALRLV